MWKDNIRSSRSALPGNLEGIFGCNQVTINLLGNLWCQIEENCWFLKKETTQLQQKNCENN